MWSSIGACVVVAYVAGVWLESGLSGTGART